MMFVDYLFDSILSVADHYFWPPVSDWWICIVVLFLLTGIPLMAILLKNLQQPKDERKGYLAGNVRINKSKSHLDRILFF